MKSLTFEQMEQVNGEGWQCWFGVVGTTIAYAGYASAAVAITVGTAGTAAPFLISGAIFILSFASTADACGW